MYSQSRNQQRSGKQNKTTLPRSHSAFPRFRFGSQSRQCREQTYDAYREHTGTKEIKNKTLVCQIKIKTHERFSLY
jgi:hypothetical protein